MAAGAIVAATLVTTGGNPVGLAPQRGGEALDARTVLLAAAEKADGQTETMRAYWHQVTISSHLYMVGTGADHYGVVVRQKAETWTPSKPDVKTWTLQQNLGAKPATQADMAAWKRGYHRPRSRSTCPRPPSRRDV